MLTARKRESMQRLESIAMLCNSGVFLDMVDFVVFCS